MKDFICADCQEGTCEEKEGNDTAEMPDGTTVEFWGKWMECDNCGAKYYTRDQLGLSLRRVYHATYANLEERVARLEKGQRKLDDRTIMQWRSD